MARTGAKALAWAAGISSAAWSGQTRAEPAAPTCVTIQRAGAGGDVFDAHVLDTLPSTSFGASNALSAGTQISSSGVAQHRRALIKFDLAFLQALPDVHITSATASFSYYLGSNPSAINAHLVTSSWSEQTVTWSNAPSFATEAIPLVAGGSSTASVDLTSLVDDWVHGAPNQGILLESGSTNISFRSSEWSPSRPLLQVCYTLGSGSGDGSPGAICLRSDNAGGATGADCSNPEDDRKPCDYLADRCVLGSYCSDGVCKPGQSHVQCFDGQRDSCHLGGACNPTTGACEAVPKEAGAFCTDGNPYTEHDTCSSAGVCIGTSDTSVPSDDSLHGRAECSGLRWVGALHFPGSCPAATPGWAAQKPFTGCGSSPVAPALDLYCLYTWDSSGGPAPTVAHVKALGQMWTAQTSVAGSPPNTLQGDCAEMGSLATAFDQATRAELRQAFNARAGALDPNQWTPPPAGSPLPFVVVADTAPSTDDFPVAPDFPLRSEHGPLMVHVIRDLLCPNGPASCPIHVGTRLALSYYNKEQSDPVAGGYFGTAIELGQSIHQSLCNAQGSGQSGSSHVIVNLSIGSSPGSQWTTQTPGPQGTVLSDPPPFGSSERAVYDTLQVASCEGAILIAAAGNNPGGELAATPPPSGPAYPAKWQQLLAPDTTACQALTGHASFAPAPRPLVYAASGVDDRDQPLMNRARGSRAPIAALGLLATSSDDPRNLPTPESGSSLAAAVTSAAAAAVWAYRPELSPDQVMRIVHDSGALLSIGPPELDYPEALALPKQVRRISVCEAAQRACDPAFFSTYGAPTTASCPAVLPACAPPPPPLMSCSWHETFDEQIPQAPSPVSLVADAKSPSETYQAEMAAPWIQPFPGNPKCPTCALNLSTGDIYVTVDRSVLTQNLVLTDAMVLLDVGLRVQLLPAGGSFTPGVTYVYQISNSDWTPQLARSVSAASISFHLTDTTTPDAPQQASSLEPMIVR